MCRYDNLACTHKSMFFERFKYVTWGFNIATKYKNTIQVITSKILYK